MRSENQRAVETEGQRRFRWNFHLFAAGKDLCQQAASTAGSGADSSAPSAAENAAEQRADRRSATTKFGGAAVGADALLAAEIYIGGVHTIFLAVDADGEQIQDQFGTMHGAAGGDISYDEFRRSSRRDGNVAGDVGDVLADGRGVELAGGGRLGIDGFIGADGDLRADGNNL